MSVAAKLGKKAVRLLNGIVNTTVLLVIMLLLIFACYAIWDTGQVHGAAEAAHYEKFKPTVENAGVSFEELRTINSDVFAWLTVYGTNIDYPVVQGRDNMRYVNTNAMGEYSLSGAIFLDYQNSKDFSDFNNILYGHHMEKKTMFGEIGLFAEKAYFDARRYGSLYFDGEEHGLEFFGFVHTDAYDSSVFRANLKDPDAKQAYLDMLYQKALHTRGDIPVTVDDRIVLLSTCSEVSTNGRDLLLAIITDGTFKDPFFGIEQTPDRVSLISSIDHLPGLFVQAPLGAKIIIAALPFLLIILMLVMVNAFRKKRRSTSRHKQNGRYRRSYR